MQRPNPIVILNDHVIQLKDETGAVAYEMQRARQMVTLPGQSLALQVIDGYYISKFPDALTKFSPQVVAAENPLDAVVGAVFINTFLAEFTKDNPFAVEGGLSV